MKAIISNYRYWVLLLIAFVAALGTFSVPQEEAPTLTWLYVLVTSKIIGFFAWIVFYGALTSWRDKGKLPELDGLTEE